ncbi:MAG: ribonuclease H-like domain-containing protein, partial [Acidobacteriaceae bacterium]|nr:ribonuclease H-like domain-containing protein [Acidobacteriaceae bacterium]
QLAELRKRIAKIDRKYAAPRPSSPAPRAPRPEKYFVEEWSHGRVVETDHGRHYELDKLFERHRRHGSVGIQDLEDLPPDLLHPISDGLIEGVPPQKWAFLDTETTGLAGGAGTYAFLIGVGSVTTNGFLVRQFFMREFAEETSLLLGLSEYLKGFDVLITYNGKTYDQPLLETRYRMARTRPPFAAMNHLDLLFGARRLWKLRFDRCRLVDLEYQILGIEREGDLPGEMIPYVYFEYLRTREAFKLVPILHHNQIDILTLACLTAIVPWAFHNPEKAQFQHGAEMVGLARWWRQAENYENALQLFRQAVQRDLDQELLARTLFDIALLEKKLGREDASLPVLTELAGYRNPFQTQAFEELAKYYEHRERNYAVALEMTLAALQQTSTDALQRRATRLQKRLAEPKTRRLL